MSGSAAAKPFRWKTTRWKNSPFCGSVVYWSRETMFPSFRVISEVTVEASPGLSGPVTISVARSSRAAVSRCMSVTPSASGGEVADPFGRVQQTSEGVEVHFDVVIDRVCVDRSCEFDEELVGTCCAEEVGEGEAVLLDDGGTRSDAESSRIPEQPFDARVSRSADADE